MKRFYVVLIAAFLAVLAIFVGSFFFIDKEKHTSSHYVISREGHAAGTVRIDRYSTEDKLVYTSSSSFPLESVMTSENTRLTLDRSYRLESYERERGSGPLQETLSFDRIHEKVTYLSRTPFDFIVSSGIAVKNETFVFDRADPLTYLPILERYDFIRGRSQGFPVLALSDDGLPPAQKTVTFTSIRDEYLSIGARRVKAECLIMKARGLSQTTVWVSKSDRTLLKIESPAGHMTIMRTFSPRALKFKSYVLMSDTYASKETVFDSKDTKISATLTIPSAATGSPSVILVPGAGPETRDMEGLFPALADRLSRAGYCVLRFDKRGVGESGGDYSTSAERDDRADVVAAIEFIQAQKEIDPRRIALIGYGKGAFNAATIASERAAVRALVMLAPSSTVARVAQPQYEHPDLFAARFGWSDEYLKTVMASRSETLEALSNAVNDIAVAAGKKIRIKRMRESLDDSPLESVMNIRIPVLIMQGREDDPEGSTSARSIDRAIEASGNKAHTLVYYTYLDSRMGSPIIDDVHKDRFVLDSGVADALIEWLDRRIGSPK